MVMNEHQSESVTVLDNFALVKTGVLINQARIVILWESSRSEWPCGRILVQNLRDSFLTIAAGIGITLDCVKSKFKSKSN